MKSVQRFKISVLIVFVCVGLGFLHQTSAQIPKLVEVPEALPAQTRSELTKVKIGLQEDRNQLQAKAQRLSDQCTNITEGTASAAKCAEVQAELEKVKQKYIRAVNKFKLSVVEAVSLRIQSITAQIEETKRQLTTLGFDDRTNDFERLGEISARERAHMTGELLGQLKDLAMARGEKAMEDYFLGKIKSMKPEDVEVLANKLQKAGADDAIFQEWLRSFSSNASREVLVSGARETIKYLKTEQKLFKLDEQLDSATVEARQDAALGLMSLVFEHPALTELKAVAAAVYTVAEAGVYLYVLQKNIDHLNDITLDQLQKQKVLIRFMEELVRDRKLLRAEIRAYPRSTVGGARSEIHVLFVSENQKAIFVT